MSTVSPVQTCIVITVNIGEHSWYNLLLHKDIRNLFRKTVLIEEKKIGLETKNKHIMLITFIYCSEAFQNCFET